MAKKSKNTCKVIPALTGFELSVLAAILEVMADRGKAAKTTKGSARKMRALRDAIPKGLGSGGMESVPREILKEDCRVARMMVKHLTGHSSKLRKTESQVREIINGGPALVQFGHLEIHWPWPIGSTNAYCPFDKPMPPAKRAHFVVSKRYGIPQETVRRAQAKRSRGSKSTQAWWQSYHAMLAWVFTDLCVVEAPSAAMVKRRNRIFKILMSTGYEPFTLYYRLILAQSTGTVRAHKPSAAMRPTDLDNLLKLAEERE